MIELPWPPVSTNRLWRNYGGRMVLSSEAKKYKETVWGLSLQGKWPRLSSNITLTIDAHPPSRRHFDIDNILKLPIDSLQYAKILENDSQIKKLLIELKPVIKGGKLMVWLEEY